MLLISSYLKTPIVKSNIFWKTVGVFFMGNFKTLVKY
jgi:hypothetical protein